ncbi:hypothetical protein QLX67_13705, partial [Balneolaceae bacterium ANBcel3]|nr:hypothetical protein [Balneolaceae bacterium ANBcel3]
NRDAVQQDLLAAATAAQGIWQRPVALGGVGRNFEDTDNGGANNIMPLLNIPAPPDGIEDNVVTNENAVYTLTVAGASELSISAEPTTWNYDMTMVVCRAESGTGDDTRMGWVYGIQYGDGTGTTPACDDV